MKQLKWQKECLEQWEANGFKGIVNAVTGSGKTFLALCAVKMLMDMDDPRPLKIKIVVPKTFLLYQWRNELIEFFEIPRESIGFYSGEHKTKDDCKFMIYVINSARYSLARHIVRDIKSGERVLLIADECHHYSSEENSKIFDFIHYVSYNAPYYTLGLSATPYGKRYNEILVPALGDEIYHYTILHALKENVISKFIVFNVSVPFNWVEADEYEELSNRLTNALNRLKRVVPTLYIDNGQDLFMRLENIIKNAEPNIAKLARQVLSLSIRRKELVYLAKHKLDCVTDIVSSVDKSDNVIIFSERIETAEEIYKRLLKLDPNNVGLYHSKISKDQRKNLLRQFENNEIKVLVSCKTLDEGLNIPEADVGIIVSTTGSRRQRIQRLGRILRKKHNDRSAKLYYLFVRNTTDEEGVLEELTRDSLNESMNVVNVRYNENNGAFFNAHFKELVATAVSEMSNNNHDTRLIGEFLHHAKTGLLTGEWLLNEDVCVKKIESATNKAEKNYYIAMLMLIKARSR